MEKRLFWADCVEELKKRRERKFLSWEICQALENSLDLRKCTIRIPRCLFSSHRAMFEILSTIYVRFDKVNIKNELETSPNFWNKLTWPKRTSVKRSLTVA